MPFTPHFRLTLAGTLGPQAAPVEAFSMGVNLSSPTVGPADPYESVDFGDLVADCNAFWQRPGTGIWTGAILREIKLAHIGADGKYTREPMIGTSAAFGGGSGTNPSHAFQVAAAVSLITERRGASGRGRFYVPCPQSDIGPDGLFSTAFCDALSASAGQFLSDLANQPGIDTFEPRPIVASSLGVNSNVTGVRVGRVPDTIRTRRRQLDEQYRPATAVG